VGIPLPRVGRIPIAHAIGLPGIYLAAAGTTLKTPWPVGDDVHT
jgi:hypothetical protein